MTEHFHIVLIFPPLSPLQIHLPISLKLKDIPTSISCPIFSISFSSHWQKLGVLYMNRTKMKTKRKPPQQFQDISMLWRTKVQTLPSFVGNPTTIPKKITIYVSFSLCLLFSFTIIVVFFEIYYLYLHKIV